MYVMFSRYESGERIMMQRSVLFLYSYIGKIGVTTFFAIPGCVLAILAVKKYLEPRGEKIAERPEQNDGVH